MEIKVEYLLDSVNTLRFRNIEIKYFREMGYLHSKIHCLTLDLLCTAVISALKLFYFSDLLDFESMHIFVCK